MSFSHTHKWVNFGVSYEGVRMQRRFVIVSLLLLVLTCAVLLCRHVSKEYAVRLRQQASRQRYHEHEQRRDRPKATPEVHKDGYQLSVREGFGDSKRRGAIIRRAGNSFQRENFASAVLDDATLEAGTASFQLACFDKASLRNAKLTGGISSFQGSTFVGADLSAARLNGSFQMASFEHAILKRASWSGSFQVCNISGAYFAGADLSEIDKSALESCYFAEAPTYRPDTKFPTGFDPISQGWRMATE
ncbi:MAG: hypothetical protein JWM11_568 [Planctomycetaceae bacterium]|nr:hypothetical protein [Planctomycetaceae bacterium]